MKYKLLIAGIVIGFLSACNNTDRTSGHKHDKDADKSSVEKVSHNEESGSKLPLDNGSKWKANAETTQGIENMSALLNEYVSKGNTDSKKLSEDLSTEFTTILKKCTMTGAAHDQLHNYLLPLKAKIDQLPEIKNDGIVQEIRAYLDNYKNYFE